MTSHASGRLADRRATSRYGRSRTAASTQRLDRRQGEAREQASMRARLERPALTTVAGLGMGSLVVGAMILGSSVLTLLTSVMVMVASVLFPMVGLVTIAFLAPLARPLVIPPPGFYIAVAVAMVFGMIVRLPLDRPKLRLPRAEVILLGAFVLYAVTHFFAGFVDGASGATGRDAQSLVLRMVENLAVLGVAYVVLRDRSPYPVLVALLAAAAVASVIGLSQLLEAEAFFTNLIVRPDPSGRISGVFGNTNYFGAYLGSMVALAVALAIEVPPRRYKAVLLSLAALLATTLVFTQSRGALIAVAAGLMTVAFVHSLKTGVLALAGLVMAGIVAYPAFAAWRFGDGDTGLTTAAGRTDAWIDGFESFLSSPLLGIGLGRFKEESTGGIAAHNWYVQVTAELGFVGILMWVLFIGAIALAMRGRPRPARAVGYAVLVAWLVAGLTMAPPGLFRFTAPVLIVVAAACVALWPATSRGSGSAAAELSTADVAGRERDRPDGGPVSREAAQ